MSKIKIEVPDTLLFKVSIPVRITDINYGNHVGNDSIVSILHDARMQWLGSAGLTEIAIGDSGLIMAGLSVEFKAEALYGDLIQIDLSIGDVSAYRFDLFYKLITTRNQERILLATAVTAMVSFDYRISKPVRIPEVLLTMLNVRQ